MWANLTSLVQQLLQETVMEVEDSLSASLAMAGTLADTAGTLLQANPAGASCSTTTNIPAGSKNSSEILQSLSRVEFAMVTILSALS